MGAGKKFYENNGFESTIKEYLKQARNKLEHELTGTREAMRLIAIDKTQDFLKVMDRGLDKEERDYLSALIVASMYQSFCYGYGIGKIEGKSDSKIIL
ncbi:hypothetical protein [Acetivibrio cellulolyticus]|uniref:hypothetical protein n=1 Tax=Acetivibrio cellulolyticus TaxID=35830 RepID=UPI0001E2C2E0|nr:hypothetical protein [Acetivibrio cellulolyticus]